MRRIRALAAAGLIFSSVLVLAPAMAEAKGVAVFNTGEDIFEVGDLPEELTQGKDTAGWKAGYKCSIFGLLWAYMHWWECEPVAFQGDTYDNSPEVAKAVSAKYTTADIQMGAWQKHGRWAFAGLIVLGVAGGIIGKMRS